MQGATTEAMATRVISVSMSILLVFGPLLLVRTILVPNLRDLVVGWLAVGAAGLGYLYRIRVQDQAGDPTQRRAA